MRTGAADSNPYPGPRPFEAAEQPVFFGRDAEIADLTSLVIAHRVVLVYAQSGAGKTSLLNAGVIPSLVERGFTVWPPARVRGLLAQELDPAAVANVYVLNTLMGWRGEEADTRPYLLLSLAEFLARRDRPTDEEGFPRPSIIVFDQFEELFAFYPERWADREGFFRQVAEALQSDPLLRVLFVMREDYLASLDPFANLLPDRLATRYRLERLRPHAACAAVEGPLHGMSRTFAPGVASSLIDQLLTIRVETAGGRAVEVAGEFVEPVQLQVTCQSLWNDLPADVTMITSDHVRTFGDVHQALREFYEDTLVAATRQSGIDEAILRGWFDQHLITPSGTRGTVYRGPDETAGIPNQVVDLLEDRHLVRAELRAGARWYELTHDRFIRPIQSSNESWRQHLSLTRLQGQMQSTLRRFRRASLALVLIAVAAVILSLEIARRRVQSHELAAKALLNLSIDPEESLRLAVRAAETAPRWENDPEIEDALRQSLRESRVRLIAAGHTAPVLTAAFSPDGKSIVTASQDHSARVWEANTGNSRTIEGHTNDIVSAGFSPDGRLILTASLDGTARLWQADTGEASAVLEGQGAPIATAVFSPDGSMILTGGADGSARIWDTGTREALQNLTGHAGPIIRATFSPDGALVATSSRDGTVRVWEVATGRTRIELASDAAGLSTAAFSADGVRLVTASDDGAARVWDVTTGRTVLTLVGHSDQLNDATFSPDGTLVLTASDDGTARIWNATSGSTAAELRGHLGRVLSASFSPDGTRVLSASDDGTARIWNGRIGAPLGTLRGHQASVTSAAFSSDGRRVVTSSADSTARVWDVTDGQITALRAHAAGVSRLAFSHDGNRVVSQADDGTVVISDARSGEAVRKFTAGVVTGDGNWVAVFDDDAAAQLWDPATGTLRGELPDAPQPLDSAIIASGGRRLAIAAAEQSVHVWDASTRQNLTEISYDEPIWQIALSRDGTMLLAAGGASARIYHLESGAETALQNYTGAISDAAFSPDGRRIVIASGDQTARVWNTRTGESTAVLEGHSGWVTSAAFNPVGSRIVTGSTDQTARVWDLDGGTPVELRGHSSAVIAVAFQPGSRASDSRGPEFVLTSSAEGNARIWAVGRADATGVMQLRGSAGPLVAAFSPDGRLVATGQDDGIVRVSECEACQPARELIALARARIARFRDAQ